jgi:hypothetical protein
MNPGEFTPPKDTVEIVFAQGPNSLKRPPWSWLAGFGAFCMGTGKLWLDWHDADWRERTDWVRYSEWLNIGSGEHEHGGGERGPIPITEAMGKRMQDRWETWLAKWRELDDEHQEPAP